MRSFTVSLVALFCLLQIAAARRRFKGFRCATSCRFTLCRKTVVSLGLPNDEAQTRAICLRGRRIGIANTGEARVRTRDNTFTRISEISPSGLRQPFSPSFFKTYTLKSGRFSGIGHEVPQQNQAGFLNGRCIALPIQEYQVIKKVGDDIIVIDNKRLSRKRPLRNCVSFRVSSV